MNRLKTVAFWLVMLAVGWVLGVAMGVVLR